MRQKIALVVKIVISITLLYFALGKMDIASVQARLQDVSFTWLAAALAILLGQIFLSTGRWHIIAGLCGVVIAYSRAFRFALIGIFFNQTLPSSVGGDAVRIWLLVRDGASWSSSTYSVLLDRIVGLLALSFMVVGSLAWALVLITDPTARLTLIVIGFGTLSGFVVFVLLRHARHSSLMRWNPARHLVQLSTIAGDALFSLKTGPAVIVFSLCIHFLTVLAAWCLGKAAHTPFDLLQALVVIPPVILISTIPISIAGWGVRETALALAFSYVGLSQTDGIIVSLLLGASMVALGFAGGIVWLLTSHATPQSNPAQNG